MEDSGKRELDQFNTTLGKNLYGSNGTVLVCIIDFIDVPEVEEAFSTGYAGTVGYKDDFGNRAGAVAVDYCVFFGVEATTVARFVTVAAVGKTCCVSVVAYCKDFTKVFRCDDSTDLETAAGGALSKCCSKLEVNLLERRTGAHRIIPF